MAVPKRRLSSVQPIISKFETEFPFYFYYENMLEIIKN